jgi:ribosomal protein S18 acetylase RimI-like enzyme
VEEGCRLASPADAVRLAELAAAAFDELRPQRGGAVWSRREARARPPGASILAALDDPERLVVAGTIDEVIVGYGVVRREQLRTGEWLGVVEDLFVEPGAREVGIGEAMMGHLLSWCRAQGCAGIDALALPGNRAAKNFFERFGLTARAIVVHRDLREPSEGEA